MTTLIRHDNAGRCTELISYEGDAFQPGGDFIQANEEDLTVADLQNMVVVNGAVEQRKPFPQQFTKHSLVANMNDATTLRGLPKGTQVEIDGQLHIVNDGQIDIVVTTPGQHIVHIDPFPYHPFEVQINAN
jgi:hypothetical protein